ncbi:leucine-rich repeat domain-containing protein [Rickettsia bellii]|uniref:Leucine Rich repeat family protein n=1 Tax=Rickettsia bellii str. RML Mogi TaxID=1359194 RepID=A0A0F3QG20_RICBE|nr:ribonuclease inhibitor [Rickettsia bellii]KJV91535.1 leucine Rich repeat family protein [Rickettsia bellii str. RML Mogi]
MFRGQFQTPQEISAAKTSHENLIEFVEKRGLKQRADNLRHHGTMLNLHENQIDDAGAKELAAALKANNHLTELYFSNNNINNNGAKFIAKALKDNDSLTHLDLSGNNINKAILETINEYLQRNKTIAEKKAQNLNTEKEVEKKYEEQQKQILSENNEFAETVNKFFHDPTSVSLCYQIITDDFAQLVADKLKINKTITAIDFMGSTISDQGIKIITEALKASTQLKKLDFSGCDLGNQKISVLAEVLQLNTLTHLCLNTNYIGTVGIKAIIEALKENTTITHIDLEQNNIDQQSQIIIEKYLQRNKNIEKTDDKFQKLTDDLNDKISNNATINVNDKTKIAEQLKNIACKAKLLINKVDIEQVTNNLQDLLSKNKITKGNIIDLEDEINAIIDHQNIADDISISGSSGDSSFI